MRKAHLLEVVYGEVFCVKKYIVDFLRNNPIFWSRLGFCYDPPIKGEDGLPIVFSKNYEKFINYHRMFAKAGVKIHTSMSVCRREKYVLLNR